MKTYVIQNVDRIVRRKDYERLGTDKLLVTSYFRTVQGEGPYAGHPAVFLRLSGCNFGDKSDHCQFCFPSTKEIQTPQGTRPIGDLNVGDSLFTLDENFQLTTTTIKKKMQRRVTQGELVRITYEASRRIGGNKKRYSIVCTGEHPFHVKDKGYVAAKDLTLDDVIYHVKGNDIMSLQKKLNNPMFDPEVKAKSRKNRTTEGLKYERTKWHRKNLSELRKAKNPMFDSATQLKMLKSKKYKKSGPEKLVSKLFKAIGVDATYVGNKLRGILGNEEVGYSRPDFIIGNKVFEVYDTTFPMYAEGLRTKDNYEVPKRKWYKALGYEVCFITEHTLGGKFEITDASVARFGIAVNKFLKNGARVVGVEFLDDKGFSQQNVGEDGLVEVTNFSCSPYNTYLMDGLHTHNCDTSFRLDQGVIYSFEELTRAIYDLKGYSKSDILVITGGEPTLQPALLDWIDSVTDMFKRVQIETNGTQVSFFKELDDRENIEGLGTGIPYVRPSIVVSPKASMKAQRYAEPSELVKKYASCFKFVVTADKDDPHHTVPEWALELARLNRRPVYISPMAVYKKPYAGEVSSAWDHDLIDAPATAANYAYAAEYALANPGLLLSIQQHLFLGVA